MKIRSFLLPVLILAFVTMLTGCSDNKLKIYIPVEYISPEAIADFEKKYDAEVSVEFFASNEDMYESLKDGGEYDLLLPSDYMIERLISEDLLETVNKRNIPNISAVNPALTEAPLNDYDPMGDYSVPYSWGSVGIAYNSSRVSSVDVEALGFEILRDQRFKGRIYLYDSERDMFMTALKSLGYSMNTSDENEIQKAFTWLHSIFETMEPTVVTEEARDGMLSGRKDIAVMYSGDAARIMEKDENIRFSLPRSGTNLWVDAFVIPKRSDNSDLAHKFIDHMCGYEASLLNTEYLGYPTVNIDVLSKVTGAKGDFAENEAYLPRSGYARDEMFKDNEYMKMKLTELWFLVKE